VWFNTAGYDTQLFKTQNDDFSAIPALCSQYINADSQCVRRTQQQSRKTTAKKNTVLILARSPASIKSTYCTGRSSDLFRLSRLPSFHQWQRERQTNFRNPRNGTHSNRHCSGFSPDSLFTFRDAQSLKAPCAKTKIEKIFLGCTLRCVFLSKQAHRIQTRWAVDL